jgi:hypothetical protein
MKKESAPEVKTNSVMAKMLFAFNEFLTENEMCHLAYHDCGSVGYDTWVNGSKTIIVKTYFGAKKITQGFDVFKNVSEQISVEATKKAVIQHLKG